LNTIRMDRLSWVEYQGRVREEQAPVILPVGATEQHGTHLPLVTTALMVIDMQRDFPDPRGWRSASGRSSGPSTTSPSTPGPWPRANGTSDLEGSVGETPAPIE
jgi:creatinine amidohydrolase/Fe(II)-dependent formamide hydrolase-like protein